MFLMAAFGKMDINLVFVSLKKKEICLLECIENKQGVLVKAPAFRHRVLLREILRSLHLF